MFGNGRLLKHILVQDVGHYETSAQLTLYAQRDLDKDLCLRC